MAGIAAHPRRWALFLDFDGTLVDIAARPDQVLIPARLIAILRRLQRRLAGALAIVSGRPILELDRLLAPLKLAASGGHGAELRRAPGAPIRRSRPPADLDRCADVFAELVQRHPRLMLERKGASVALHYRAEPELGPLLADLAGRLVAGSPQLHVMGGKMVLEIRASARSKRTALESLLRAAPFRGRTPLFIGDDITDLDAFGAARAAGGLAASVGAIDSRLCHTHFRSPRQLLDWLDALGAPAGARGRSAR